MFIHLFLRRLEPGTVVGMTMWCILSITLGSSVNAVGQDGDGYLWLATNNGLFRLDGVRFTHWNPPDGSSRQDRVGASRPSESKCAKEF